jgi:hypothetical protein
MLYNLQTHEEQTILEPVFHAAVPIFDAASQHIAYAAITHSQDGITYQWTIHVRDITTDVETIFEGPIVGQGQDRYAEPLPGRPIAWVGNELFLDGFVPYAETVYWGIRVLDLRNVSPGETISLRDYDRLVLSPGDVYYMYPTISPVGDMMAFVVYNDDHLLTCYDNFPENGAVTGLGVIPIAGGAPRILVDATGDDSALVGQPLAWSLDGNEILFAQGSCQDEPSSLEPTLRTVNVQGVITREWPLARIEYTICQEALWCAPEQIFYSRRYLREQDQLWRLNAETGQTEQVLSSEQIRLIGCFP